MMDNRFYKVLWFDDEHERLEGVKFSALEAGIKLVGFTNKADGLNELNKNASLYDAIILDGLFYTSAYAAEKGSDIAFAETARELDKRSKELNLEWFILSGQTSFSLNSQTIISLFGQKRVFDKNKDHELDELWHEVKHAADNRDLTKIKNLYPQVFECLSADYWNKQAAVKLLNILKHLELSPELTPGESLFNDLRKVIEYLFRACNKLGLLHDDLINDDKVNLSWSLSFLSGYPIDIPLKGAKITCRTAHFPPLINKMLRFVLDVCNSASHTLSDAENDSNLSIGLRQSVTQSSFLLRGCCLQVMDVILWLDHYARRKPVYSNNVALWEKADLVVKKAESGKEAINGTVIRIAENGYGTFEDEHQTMNLTILPKLVQEHDLKKGDKVLVITKEIIEKIDTLRP